MGRSSSSSGGGGGSSRWLLLSSSLFGSLLFLPVANAYQTPGVTPCGPDDEANIHLEKTVKIGTEGSSPTSCSPGQELAVSQAGTVVTYCYEITNTGNTYLNDVSLSDECLPFTATYASPITNGILAPGGQIRIPYFATIEQSLDQFDCLGYVVANPIDPSGSDLDCLDDVTDEDPAGVDVVTRSTDCVETITQTELGAGMLITITEQCDFCECPNDSNGATAPPNPTQYPTPNPTTSYPTPNT